MSPRAKPVAATKSMIAFAVFAMLGGSACRSHRLVNSDDGGTPAVRLHLHMQSGAFGSPDEHDAVLRLSDRVHEALAARHLGVVQGNEYGGGECVMILRGPESEQMWQAIAPIVTHDSLAQGGRAELQMADGRMRRVTW